MKTRNGHGYVYTYKIGGLTFGPYYRELTKAEQERLREHLRRDRGAVRLKYDPGRIATKYQAWCEEHARQPMLEYPEGHTLVIGECGSSRIEIYTSAKGNPLDTWMHLCKGTPNRPAPQEKQP